MASFDIDIFKTLIKNQFGLNFHDENESVLIQAIHHRMQVTGLIDPEQYYHRLNVHTDERQTLIDQLTNNETYFYREAQQLELLTQVLIPQIQLKQTEPKPIRILSLGCSIGAEPYSIAIALQEQFGLSAKSRYLIIGADIDYSALAVAKAACYRSLVFRGLSPDLKQRYFTEALSAEFKLIPLIRDRVSFCYLNLLSEHVPVEMTGMDVIFFRNVSIYFDAATRMKMQQKIAKLLNPRGYLIVGMTETLSNDLGVLQLKNAHNQFFFQKRDPENPDEVSLNPHLPVNRKPVQNRSARKTKQENPMRAGPSQSSPQPVASIKTKDETKNHVDAIKTLITQKKYDEALQAVSQITNQSKEAQYLLLKAFILFNRQDFDSALQAVKQALAMEPLSIDGFLLQGMIAKWQQQPDAAIESFKKALSLHPDCWPAHYYLSGLYRETGLMAKAVQECRLVLQQLSDAQENFAAKMLIPWGLPKAEIRLICQSHLDLMVSGKQDGS